MIEQLFTDIASVLGISVSALLLIIFFVIFYNKESNKRIAE
jgi:hypothetical protein